MEPINIYDAKTHLSKLVDRVQEGEEVVIARHGKPVARLIPYAPRREHRTLGAWSGQIWIAPDFDDTPDEVIRSFEGSDGEEPA
ncbi:MAG TPA: type II toxin-antitoxin system Phd/YefM family antitoxin [Gemmatimonadales bacterium]|nr:type II toxin-antitoxin system Phd/YefM family antitoxin [Gemmatimonadales bacterium]